MLRLPVTRVFRFMQKTVADIAQNRPQDRKQDDIDQIPGTGIELFSQENCADPQTEGGGKKRRPGAAGKRREDDNRDINHRKRAVLEVALKYQQQTKCHKSRQSSQSVAKPEMPLPSSPILPESGNVFCDFHLIIARE